MWDIRIQNQGIQEAISSIFMIVHSVLGKAQVNDCADVVGPQVKSLLISRNSLLQIHIVGHACTELIPHWVVHGVLLDTEDEALTCLHVVTADEIQNSERHQHLCIVGLLHVCIVKDLLELNEVGVFNFMDARHVWEIGMQLQPFVQVVLCVALNKLIRTTHTKQHQRV